MKSIEAYLKYLLDVSKRIGTRCFFDIAFRKPLNSSKPINSISDYILQSNTYDVHNQAVYSSYFQEVVKFLVLDKNSDKSLFIGCGLISGVLESKKQIAGPLVYLKCSISQADNYEIIEESSPILNFDLIAQILQNEKASVSEDNIVGQLIANQENSALVEKAEMFLESNYSNVDKLPLLVNSLFTFLQKNSRIFANISIKSVINIEHEIKNKDKKLMITKKAVSYYSTNDFYFFIYPIPDSLSVTMALDSLIKEINTNDFKNDSLKDMLDNVIQSDNFSNKVNKQTSFDETILDYIPLPLSINQKKSIANAWTNSVSYIQGPPGTGKSYTIAATALSAILRGKTVLILSQKVPALDVVEDKVNSIIPNLCFKYSDKNKKELKKNIELSIQEHIHGSYNSFDLHSQTEEMETLFEHITSKIKELQSKIAELKSNLFNEQEHFRSNSLFVKKRIHYRKTFKGLEKNKAIKTVLESNELTQHINIVKRITENLSINYAQKLYLCKSKYLLESHGLDIQNIHIENIYAHSYEFLNLCNLLDQSNQSKKSISNQSDTYLKQKISTLNDEIISQCKDYISLKLALTRRSLCDTNSSEINNLKKMLHWRRSDKIKKSMGNIDYNLILKFFPIWVCEIRHIGHFFPMKANMFDLVIVDEASQVNLAEIIPAFYRGKKLCIVGDHKQLSLDSTGLNFSLSKLLDELCWNKYKKVIGKNYKDAQESMLTVTKASILDFIKSDEKSRLVPQIVLNEHYRSLPELGYFTAKNFYKDEELKVMQATPEKVKINCFKAFMTGGKRTMDKTIPEEVQKIIEILMQLNENHLKFFAENNLNFGEYLNEKFTIGIIAFMRNQCELIKSELLSFCPEFFERFDLLIGTPQDYQGHEKDIMILSLGLDDSCKTSKRYYEQANLFNVATSRAKYGTLLVAGSIPVNFVLTNTFIKSFRNPVSAVFDYNQNTLPISDLNLFFDENKIESEFEQCVYEFICEELLKKHSSLSLYNKVNSCGECLDFVLYNETNDKSVALEVDGKLYYKSNTTKGYYDTEEYIERMKLLKRAGWKIEYTPYHKWYNGGWLDKKSDSHLRERKRLVEECEKILL